MGHHDLSFSLADAENKQMIDENLLCNRASAPQGNASSSHTT